MNARRLFRRLLLLVAVTAVSAGMFADTNVEPLVLNGDYNGDGSRNITDAINMFQHLYTGEATPAAPVAARCEIVDTVDGSRVGTFIPPGARNGDVNGDGSFDLSDCIYFLNWLFAGGEDPVELDCSLPNQSA